METTASDSQTRKLGHYRLERQIGRGGMGKVFLAHDEQLDRQVAVKVLSSKLAANPKYVERFYREANSAGVLNHPNIVRAIDVGEEGGHHYFVMEYIEGETLRERMKRTGPLPETEALAAVEAVAMALENAAEHHIIHRDIKPDNIMVNTAGQIKLMDMGLAKSTEDPSATVTQAGAMIGTPHYASPEQVQGLADIDGRTDIYSLGITLYHLLVGRPPFEGETAGVIGNRQIHEEVPSPREARPELSEGTARLVWRMTRKKREDRYQSATELLADVRRVVAGEEIAGPPEQRLAELTLRRRAPARQRPERGRFPVVPASIAAAVLLLALAGAYLAFRKGPATEDGGPVKVALNGGNQTAIPAATTTIPADPAPKEPEKTLEPVPIVTTVPVQPETPVDQPATSSPTVELTEQEKQEAVAFAQARATALDLLGKSSFRDALGVLEKAAETLPKDKWTPKIDDVRIEVMRLAEKKLVPALKDARSAIAASRFEEAERILGQDKGQWPDALESQSAAALEEVAAAKRLLESSRGALANLNKEVSGHLAARDYEAARGSFDRAGPFIQSPSCAAEAERLRSRVSLTEKAWQRALEELAAMQGRPYQIGKIQGKVESVEGKNVRLQSEIGSVSVPVARLTTEQVVSLAARKAEALQDKEALLGVAWLAYGEGQYQPMLPQLRKLSQEADFVALLDELDVTTRGGREAYAKTLWQEILALARERRWADLEAKLKAFEKAFSKTEHLESRKEPVEGLTAAAKEGRETNRVLRISPEKGHLTVKGPVKLKGASLTVETWVRTDRRGGILLEQGDECAWALLVDNEGVPCFVVRGGQGSHAIVPGKAPVDDGRFHHVAAVLSAKDRKAALMVDGEPTGQRDCAPIQEDAKEGLSFGSGGESSPVATQWQPYLFGGDLDEVRVWNVARSVEDVRRDNWRRLRGNEEGLVGYWNFDESARDLSPNNNHLDPKSKAEAVDSAWSDYLPAALADAIDPAQKQEKHKDLKAAVARVFRGQAEVKDNGSVEFVYPFQELKEGYDWLPWNGIFRIEGGRLVAPQSQWGSEVWHRGRFVGDVRIEFTGAWEQGTGVVLKGNAKGCEDARGLVLVVGGSREPRAWVRRMGCEEPLCEKALGIPLAESNRVRAATNGGQASLVLNDTPVQVQGGIDLWPESNSRIALTSRQGNNHWDEVRVVGWLDRQWLKKEYAGRKWQVPEGNYALEIAGQEPHFWVPPLKGVSTGEFTWEAWFRIARKSRANLFYCGSWELGTGLLVEEKGQLVLVGKIGDGRNQPQTKAQFESAPDVMPWGQWVHVAVSFDGKLMRLFVDGKGVKAGPWPAKLTERDHEFVVAQNYCGGRGLGRVDELRLSSSARYTRNFKPSERLESDDKTLAIYHFNEGEGDHLIEPVRGLLGASVRGMEWVVPDTGQPAKELVLWEALKRKDPDVFAGLEFRSREDYVSFEDRPQLNLKGPLTLELWLKVGHFVYGGGILEKGTERAHSYSLTTDEEGQRIWFSASERLERRSIGTRKLERDKLYHVAATFDKGKACLFVNGELHGEETWPVKEIQPSKGAPLVLARRHVEDNEPGFFVGRIYQVRLSNAVRYTRQFEPPKQFEKDKSAVFLLPFDEAEGLDLRDAVTRGKKGLVGRIFEAKWVPEDWSE